MTNYIVDREKLKQILLLHKSYIAHRCQELIKQGMDISKMTYGESKKLTDEFIDTIINQLPVDSLLDQVDEVMKRTVGYDSKEAMKRKESK